MKITGKIKSETGFYIGDICYVLDDDIYHRIWGQADYEDGIYSDPETGYSFAVAGTAYGDGTYEDGYLRKYDVDAGNIGLVPHELISKDTEGGHYFKMPGEAIFTAEDGTFCIELPNHQMLYIETGYEEEEDEEWEEEDE